MSRAIVRIPAPLRSFTGGADEVGARGQTIEEVLREVMARHGDLAQHIFDSNGTVRRFVNIYLEGQNIRSLDGLASPVPEGAVIHIVPAVAGGAT